MIKIRKANENDFSKIYTFRYSIYMEEFSVLNRNQYKKECDEFDEISSHYIALNNNNNIIAYLRIIPSSDKGFPFNKYLKKSFEDSIEISRFMIKKEYRKQKFLFARLLSFALNEYLQNFNFKKILVDTVIINNFIGCKALISKNFFKPSSNSFFDKDFNLLSQVYIYDMTYNNLQDKLIRVSKRLL